MSTTSDAVNLPQGVDSVEIKEQKVFDGLRFPLILTPSTAFKDKDSKFWKDWVKKNLKDIEGLLLKYGAILYRGFPFDTPTEFDQFANAFGYSPFLNVAGIGVRQSVVGNVYTATESAPGALIPFHHEMGHLSENPQILFFYCDLPAKEGGETPLALSNVVYRKMLELEPEFVNRMEREGLRYVRVAPDGDDPSTGFGRSWQSTFFVSTKEEAEKKAKASGYDFEWLKNGSMKTITEILRAIRLDKRTGKKMWFNSFYTYAIISQNDSTNVAIFPNGDTMSAEMLETMKKVMDEARVSCKWQRTDAVMIDNRAVQHSRSDFFVPPRRIMASLYNDSFGPI